jgi:two-component system OmpR family response regulator
MTTPVDQLKTAVIIEDDPEIRHILSEVLESAGFSTVSVGNGIDGIQAVLSYKPLITTLDVNMPGIDGIETLRRLRAAGYENPAAMLTSLANRQTVEDAISAGADNYIRKDTPKDEIIAALRALLAAADEENDDASAPSA